MLGRDADRMPGGYRGYQALGDVVVFLLEVVLTNKSHIGLTWLHEPPPKQSPPLPQSHHSHVVYPDTKNVQTESCSPLALSAKVTKHRTPGADTTLHHPR